VSLERRDALARVLRPPFVLQAVARWAAALADGHSALADVHLEGGAELAHDDAHRRTERGGSRDDGEHHGCAGYAQPPAQSA
jgi:hypothetical protein